MRRQTALQATLHVDEPASTAPQWLSGRLVLTNPSRTTIRVTQLKLRRPWFGGLMALAEARPEGFVPSVPHSGEVIPVECNVLPSSDGDTGRPQEIMILFGSTRRRISQTAWSVRVQYHVISDTRRSTNTIATSNPVTTIPITPKAKKIDSSEDMDRPQL